MIAGDAVAALKQRGWTLGTAESCTGGMIASMLTALPGVSEYFYGGVVAYKNEVKRDLLGVAEATLAAHGAVSAECVVEMAQGARKVLKTDCAIAVSGIAGPDGGTEDKPVGTVYVAVATPVLCETKCHILAGTRNEIRVQASELALAQLICLLKEETLLNAEDMKK